MFPDLKETDIAACPAKRARNIVRLAGWAIEQRCYYRNGAHS